VLRALEKISFEKLSELQKFILVALMEPRYAAARPREFAAAIRRLYWCRDTPNTRKSLSRALQRLEQRGYIMRLDRHWQLTDSDPSNNGAIVAIMAWAQRRELYATKMGFQGALRLLQKTTTADPEKETQKQSLSQMEQVLQAPQKERPGVKTPLDLD
jgi:DNA-binding HxlR family transcriptional regulator